MTTPYAPLDRVTVARMVADELRAQLLAACQAGYHCSMASQDDLIHLWLDQVTPARPLGTIACALKATPTRRNLWIDRALLEPPETQEAALAAPFRVLLLAVAIQRLVADLEPRADVAYGLARLAGSQLSYEVTAEETLILPAIRPTAATAATAAPETTAACVAECPAITPPTNAEIAGAAQVALWRARLAVLPAQARRFLARLVYPAHRDNGGIGGYAPIARRLRHS